VWWSASEDALWTGVNGPVCLASVPGPERLPADTVRLVPQQEPAHEVECPECGATIRARMADSVPDTGHSTAGDRELLQRAGEALRAVGKAALAVKTSLTKPYPDAPETSPWVQFMERPAREAYNLSAEIRRALAAAVSSGDTGPAPALDAAHFARQAAWSAETFGPGPRVATVLDHIRNEFGPYLAEKLQEPEFRRAFTEAQLRHDVREAGLAVYDEGPAFDDGPEDPRDGAARAIDGALDALAEQSGVTGQPDTAARPKDVLAARIPEARRLLRELVGWGSSTQDLLDELARLMDQALPYSASDRIAGVLIGVDEPSGVSGHTPDVAADDERDEVARRLRSAARWCRSERGWSRTADMLEDLAVETTYDRNEHDSLPLVRALLGVSSSTPTDEEA
jgi:hypothetical protein